MVTRRSERREERERPELCDGDGVTEDITGRSNVGEPQNRQRAAILDVATGEVKWVDAGLGSREIQLQAPVWNEAGTKAFLIARATDNKDRWILALDTATGKTRTLFTEHDEAWTGGGGGPFAGGGTGWLKHSDEIYFLSEKDGYSNLFKVVLRWRRSEASGRRQVRSQRRGIIARRQHVLFHVKRSESLRPSFLFRERRRRRTQTAHKRGRESSRDAFPR